MPAAGALEDRREIRLALVLNGGVSLAIWIGGVVAEIDRARRADSEERPDALVLAYRELLDLTASVLRTDVIAGASAGGLNGCLLAAAVATGGRIDDVRDLWIDLGSFRALLRSGLDRAPQSLLRGDDYFLPEVEREFRRRCPAQRRERLSELGREQAWAERVRLFVTGTDLAGEVVEHVDDFGSRLEDREHRALFFVEHDPERRRSTFTDPDVARKLARIARSTASFPGAFEASFCQVQDPPAARDGPVDADLRDIASFTTNRWVIDGGVLDNAPVRPAMGAVARATARGPVRRVLCYVTPYGASEETTSASRDQEPPLREVVGAAFNLPRDVTMTETLEDLEDFRRRVGERRTGRAALVEELPDLEGDARALFRLYCNQRARTSVDDVLDAVFTARLARFMRESARSTTRPRLRTEQLLRRWGGALPWIPAYANDLFDPDNPWGWGLSPIGRSATLAFDLFARALHITPPADPRTADHDAVYEARLTLSETLVWVSERQDDLVEETRAQVANLPSGDELLPVVTDLGGGESLELEGIDEDEARQLATLLIACRLYPDIVRAEDCRQRMGQVASALARGGRAALRVLARSDLAPERRERLVREIERLVAGGPDEIHARLLQLEVVHETLAPTGSEREQRLELLRINAEAPCALDGRSLPSEKLTGLGLSHFAAFYKRSWRANDWLWGRLDGAARLVDVLLQPWVLRLCIETRGIEQVIEEIISLACPHDQDGPYLASRFRHAHGIDLDDAVRQELEVLHWWNLNGEPPTQLEDCRHAVRARLQLAIAREELPVVARAAIEDVDDEKAAPDAEGARWARRHHVEATTESEKVVAALSSLRLAESESFGTEAGADLLTRNVATAAVVGSSALAAPRGGLPRAIRGVVASARGLLLALYGLTWSLTSPRRALQMLALVALLLAVVVVVWGLVADVDAREQVASMEGSEDSDEPDVDGPPGLLGVLAKTVVAAGLLVAVLRARLAGLVIVAAFVAAYLVLVLTPWPEGNTDWFARAFETDAVATAVLSVLVLGWLTGFAVGRGPIAWLAGPMRTAIRAAVLIAARLLLLAILPFAVWAVDANLEADAPTWLYIVTAVVALIAVAAFMIALQRRHEAAGLGHQVVAKRVLAVGGERVLGEVLRDLVGPKVQVRHRSGRRPPDATTATADVVWLQKDPNARIVLVRQTEKTKAAYEVAEKPPSIPIISVLGAPQRILHGPDRLASAYGGLRRLLLGPRDDAFAVRERLVD